MHPISIQSHLSAVVHISDSGRWVKYTPARQRSRKPEHVECRLVYVRNVLPILKGLWRVVLWRVVATACLLCRATHRGDHAYRLHRIIQDESIKGCNRKTSVRCVRRDLFFSILSVYHLLAVSGVWLYLCWWVCQGALLFLLSRGSLQ